VRWTSICHFRLNLQARLTVAHARKNRALSQDIRAPTHRMREIAPSRKPPFTYDLETKRFKQSPPFPFVIESARTSAAAPLAIVNPAHSFIPSRPRNVFVDHRQTTGAQHATNFAQHDCHVLRVM